MDVKVRRQLRPGEAKLAKNVWENIRLGHPQVWPYAKQLTPVCLCAGGPYLSDHIPEIRRLQVAGSEVVCVGNAGATLLSYDIKPNGHVILDGAERNKSFVTPSRDTRYFVASQCDPSVFKALENHRHVYIWHACSTPEDKFNLDEWYGKGKWIPIGSGSYITLRSIGLLNVLGYQYIYVYGLDSCLHEDSHHAYSQPNADGHEVHTISINGTKFRCNAWMVDQAKQFVDCIKKGTFGDAELAVKGDGMIATIIREGALNGRDS